PRPGRRRGDHLLPQRGGSAGEERFPGRGSGRGLHGRDRRPGPAVGGREAREPAVAVGQAAVVPAGGEVLSGKTGRGATLTRAPPLHQLHSLRPPPPLPPKVRFAAGLLALFGVLVLLLTAADAYLDTTPKRGFVTDRGYREGKGSEGYEFKYDLSGTGAGAERV